MSIDAKNASGEVVTKPDMVTLTIDGTSVSVPKGTLIIRAAEMIGTAKLFARDSGTDFTVDGDVRVSIPFIGKKIEPEVAKAIRSSLREEVEYGMAKL